MRGRVRSFGLGIFEELNAATLDTVEHFFFGRGTVAVHEVSPLAGVAALDLLCVRGYRPVEICHVMYRELADVPPPERAKIRVRVVGSEDRLRSGWTF